MTAAPRNSLLFLCQPLLGLLLPGLLAACANPPLPPEFAGLAAESPEDMPPRLWLDGTRIVGVATGLGPGGLPPAVRAAVDAVAPAGRLVHAGREWGPAGTGYRVEKSYEDGPNTAFRSVLVAADGAVLQRSHSVPLARVPASVIGAAMAVGRDVRRCEIVSDADVETGWRALVVDGAGRTHCVILDLDGSLRGVSRVLSTELQVATPK